MQHKLKYFTAMLLASVIASEVNASSTKPDALPETATVSLVILEKPAHTYDFEFAGSNLTMKDPPTQIKVLLDVNRSMTCFELARALRCKLDMAPYRGDMTFYVFGFDTGVFTEVPALIGNWDNGRQTLKP